MLLIRVLRPAFLAFALMQPQPAPAAQVRGFVRTPQGSPLAGARLTLVNGDASIVREARSSSGGDYRFDGVPAGTWTVGASRITRAYVEVVLAVAASDVVRDFALGPDVHPGRWTIIGDTNPENLYASNSGSLLPDGRIFYCHDTEEPVIFDPTTGAKTFPPSSPSQQGCHIPTLLADGRLMFIGGQNTGDFRDAVKTAKTYNFTNNGWALLPDMYEERWYPGLARLADGRLLLMGGGQRPNAQRTPTCEIYDPVTNSWARTGSMSNPSDYPPAVLLMSGKVLRSWWPPQLFDTQSGQWVNTGPMVQTNRFWPGHCDHSLVLLPDGRACAVGIVRGTLPAPSMIELYDSNTETWSLGANALVTRSQAEVVMLPTGQVFVAGGKLEDNNPSVPTNAFGETRLTDIYDALANSWRRCADMAWFREYHAVTVLVPDGRVVTTAGTGGPAAPGISNDVEAFEPPYLFRGVRPRIDTISATTFLNGASLQLGVTQTDSVTSVVLIGTNSVTHWADGGIPRVLSLPYQEQDGTLTVSIPANQNTAPVGYYMLFAMVDDIPSKGVIVRIASSTPSAVADDAPPRRLVGAVWPNPFGPETRIEWYQPTPSPLSLAVYDVRGRAVFTAQQSQTRAGWHHVLWNGRARDGGNLPTGVYWARLRHESGTWTSRIVRLR